MPTPTSQALHGSTVYSSSYVRHESKECSPTPLGPFSLNTRPPGIAIRRARTAWCEAHGVALSHTARLGSFGGWKARAYSLPALLCASGLPG